MRVIVLALTALCAGCQTSMNTAGTPGVAGNGDGSANPLIGAWELVHAEYGLPDQPVEIDQPDEPIQLKIFSRGHYAHVMHWDDGSFLSASAGTYMIDGNRYTEITHWSSTPENIGSKTSFRFRVEGDTLYMSGPVEIVDSDGNKVEDFEMMREVRRRAEPARDSFINSQER